jgi:hypothetical protein
MTDNPTPTKPVMQKGEPTPPWNPEWEMQPGDRIRLHWWGDRALPKTLGGTYATLVSFSDRLRPGGDGTNRSLKWKVRCDDECYGYRYIEPDKHIWFIYRNGVWYKVYGPSPKV